MTADDGSVPAQPPNDRRAGDNLTAPSARGRLPGKLAVAQLSSEQRELYDTLTGGPRSEGPQAFALTDDEGRLEGPFNAMLFSPRLGTALQALGAAVRYGSALTPRGREIAILVVAHASRSEFEIYAHEAVGRTMGLAELDLAALRASDFARLRDPYEHLVAATAAALCERSDLTDDEFEAARSGLGDRVLFELTTLVGYYLTLALQLRVYRVGVPGH